LTDHGTENDIKKVILGDDKILSNVQEIGNSVTSNSSPPDTNDTTSPEDNLEVKSTTIPDDLAKEAQELPAMYHVVRDVQDDEGITNREETLKDAEHSKPTSSAPLHLRTDLLSSMTRHSGLAEARVSQPEVGAGNKEILTECSTRMLPLVSLVTPKLLAPPANGTLMAHRATTTDVKRWHVSLPSS
jgi:hypothetical protein